MITASKRTCGVAIGLAAAAAMAVSIGGQQPPTFRSEANVLPLDVVVLTQDGRPVPGLQAEDFEVTVDGQPRKVLTAQFLSSASSGQSAQPAASAKAWNADDAFDAVYVSNERTGGDASMPARRIVIAIDQSSFGMAAGRNAAVAARGLLDLLHPTDLVGLAVFPPPGPVLAPTRDRQRVREALSQVTGLAEPFPRTEVPLTVSEALAWSGGSISHDQMLSVACHGDENATTLAECRAQLDGASQRVIDYARRAGRMSLQGFASVIERAGADDAPATILLISAGIYGGGAGSRLGLDDELRQMSRLAADSRATVYALFVESGFLDQNSLDRPSTGFSRADDELRLGGLQTLAGASGGTVVRVSSGRSDSFRSVSLELSAYYLLGVESQAADRDGKRHRIRIRTTRTDVSVRSREELVIPAERKLVGDEAVVEALKAVKLQRALPIRLATQVLREGGSDDKVRLIISALIDRGVDAPRRVRVGYAIRGAGRTATTGTSDVENRRLEIVGSGEGAALAFVDTAVIAPGRYLLRLAAVDEKGRIGSAQQVVDALLIGGEGVTLSDLLLQDPTRAVKEAFAPVADGRTTGDGLEAFLEIYPQGTQQVGTVVFEVSDTPGGPAISRGEVKPEKKGDRRLTAGVSVDVRPLPPGTYMLNARLLDGERLLGRTARPFRVDRPIGAGGPRAGYGFAASGGVARSFAREDVLKPDALQFFLGRLRSADPASTGEALTAATDALGEARFDGIAEALAGQPDGLSVTFLKGLALFGRGQLEPAAAQFRAALRLSNEFLPAAFYLGACYAAGGRDREAAGAWQTSLISESDARIVYEVLADAWLRLKDPKRAEAIIAEAKSRWPDDDRFAPRLAAAQALSDKRNEAFATLEPYLLRHPREIEPLFFAIRLLYEAFDAGKPIRNSAEDRALADKYGALYREAAGPNLLLVNRWVGAMTRRK